jgi:hypothetical protein
MMAAPAAAAAAASSSSAQARVYTPRNYAQPDSPTLPDGDEDTGSGDDEAGGKGGDIEKKFHDWLAKFDSYRALQRACIAHAKLAPNTPRDPSDWLALESEWMRNFATHAEQRVESPGASASLLGFKAWAWVQHTQSPATREPSMGLQVINEVFVRTAVWSSQHTDAARVRWPTDLEWARFKALASDMMVHQFRAPTVDALYNALQDFKPAHVTPHELEQEFEERKMPEALKVELELRRKQAERDIARGKADVKVDVSEEASGALWREAPEEICANLPFRVARLICKVEFDESLLVQYPVWDEAAVQFTPSTYARARRWLVTKCRMEQPEDVTALFRDLATQMMWPLGSDTEKYRSRITVNNLSTALDVLSSEIGANLSQHVHDRMLKPFKDILAATTAPPTVLWDGIFLALFEFEMIQKINLRWLADYFILNPHEAKARKRMSSRRFRGVLEQRPIVVMCCRRWWLFSKRRMIPCGTSLLHAVLAWLHCMRNTIRTARTKE